MLREYEVEIPTGQDGYRDSRLMVLPGASDEEIVTCETWLEWRLKPGQTTNLARWPANLWPVAVLHAAGWTPHRVSVLPRDIGMGIPWQSKNPLRGHLSELLP